MAVGTATGFEAGEREFGVVEPLARLLPAALPPLRRAPPDCIEPVDEMVTATCDGAGGEPVSLCRGSSLEGMPFERSGAGGVVGLIETVNAAAFGGRAAIAFCGELLGVARALNRFGGAFYNNEYEI